MLGVRGIMYGQASSIYEIWRGQEIAGGSGGLAASAKLAFSSSGLSVGTSSCKACVRAFVRACV